MLQKTEGIVLKQIKYSDSSRILSVYTQEQGRQSFMINGWGKKKSQAAMVSQPLSIVDILVHMNQSSKGMGRIREIKLSYSSFSIRDNMIKTSIALFMNEVLSKCIKEEEPDEQLFAFLKHAIISLDNVQANLSNFHLIFLLKLSRFLGIQPRNNFSTQNNLLDLQEGHFVTTQPNHNFCVEPSISVGIANLLEKEYEDNCSISGGQRSAILQSLMNYYELHLHNFKDIKSHKVLAQVLS